MKTPPYLSDYALEHYRRGYESAKPEAEALGEIKGWLRGTFEARGVVLTDEARRRIRWCKDLELLETWAGRLAESSDPDEVFA